MVHVGIGHKTHTGALETLIRVIIVGALQKKKFFK